MIRAAIVGLGRWGRIIVQRMVGSDRLRIVAAVELDPSAYAEFAQRHGLTMLASLEAALADPDIDAIILATPHPLHSDQVIAAAAANKHVFCEKPLALRRADAERSVAACRAAGVVLGVGHERRFEPGIARLFGMVRDGKLGTILQAEGSFSHNNLVAAAPDNWRLTETPSTAGMHGMAIHLTDACVAMFGEAELVHAITAARVMPSGDVVSVLLRFTSGPTAFVTALSAIPLYLRFAVFGSEGWAEVRNLTHPDTPGAQIFTWRRRSGEETVETLDWVDSVRANIEAFADAAEGGASYPITDSQKIANVAIVEAVARSVTTAAPVVIGSGALRGA